MADSKLPTPVSTRTPRCLASPERPRESVLTTASLRARIAGRSRRGSPKWMPASRSSLAESITSAMCRSVFEGMQPTLRHTPPSVEWRSTSATALPRSAARKAAVYPPGPRQHHQVGLHFLGHLGSHS